MSKAFSQIKVNGFEAIFNRNSKTLMKKLENYSGKGVSIIRTHLKACVMDNLCGNLKIHF